MMMMMTTLWLASAGYGQQTVEPPECPDLPLGSCDNMEPVNDGSTAVCILFITDLIFEPVGGTCRLVDIARGTSVHGADCNNPPDKVVVEDDEGDGCEDRQVWTYQWVSPGGGCCADCLVGVFEARRNLAGIGGPIDAWECVLVDAIPGRYCVPDDCDVVEEFHADFTAADIGSALSAEESGAVDWVELLGEDFSAAP